MAPAQRLVAAAACAAQLLAAAEAAAAASSSHGGRFGADAGAETELRLRLRSLRAERRAHEEETRVEELHEKLPGAPSVTSGALDLLHYVAPLPFLEGKASALAGRLSFTRVGPEVGVGSGLDVISGGSPHPWVNKDGTPKDGKSILASIVSTTTSMLVWVVAVLAAGFYYRNFKATPRVDFERAKVAFRDKPFMYGPFSCFEDMEVCCWSCWCGGVRWADTMGSVGVLSFWLALALYLALAFLNALAGLLVWILVALLFAYYRQELRRLLDMKNDTSDAVGDFAIWLCCACCAVAQEARQIKSAHKLLSSNVI